MILYMRKGRLCWTGNHARDTTSYMDNGYDPYIDSSMPKAILLSLLAIAKSLDTFLQPYRLWLNQFNDIHSQWWIT